MKTFLSIRCHVCRAKATARHSKPFACAQGNTTTVTPQCAYRLVRLILLKLHSWNYVLLASGKYINKQTKVYKANLDLIHVITTSD